jgi:signal transduction histidine kinase
MIRLVGSLLTLARADAAQLPVSQERIDIRGLIEDAAEQVRPAAEGKGLVLTVRAEAPAAIDGDQDLVLQLLLNLLDNAVKYTPAGGKIEISCDAPADAIVEVAVSDTGPGIAPEHVDHVFDRFYRADDARSRDDGGAGLGLSICRWIMDAHGGAIGVESTVGGGARFIARFPASS